MYYMYSDINRNVWVSLLQVMYMYIYIHIHTMFSIILNDLKTKYIYITTFSIILTIILNYKSGL